MTDVAIVGGGVIGCATAMFLAEQGASVTVLERGELAGEASGAAAGMLAALSDEGGDRGPAFQALCLDSLSLYMDLLPRLETTGVDLRYHKTGVLHLALNDDEAAHLRQRYDDQRRLAPENTWLEGADLFAAEPEASRRAVAGLLSPREHYLDPQRLVLALASAAASHGADIRTGTPVTRLLTRRNRLAGVQTPDGRIEADEVLLAGGPWTSRLAARLGALVPVKPMRGQMLSLRGPGEPLRHVIWGQDAYLVPRENGQTFVGATVEDVGFRKHTTVAGLSRLRAAARRLAPGLAIARQTSAWAGLRPASPDGLPILGLLPGWENTWIATGHFRNGILLAAITGQRMAASLLAGRPEPSLAPFSAARFVA